MRSRFHEERHFHSCRNIAQLIVKLFIAVRWPKSKSAHVNMYKRIDFLIYNKFLVKHWQIFCLNDICKILKGKLIFDEFSYFGLVNVLPAVLTRKTIFTPNLFQNQPLNYDMHLSQLSLAHLAHQFIVINLSFHCFVIS